MSVDGASRGLTTFASRAIACDREDWRILDRRKANLVARYGHLECFAGHPSRLTDIRDRASGAVSRSRRGNMGVRTIHIEVGHTFPISVSEAFAYITDMKNWPEYWPDFIRIENPSAARWSKPSDQATIVIKLLNRERALHMTLKEFQEDARVTYISRQRGLPDVRHERHFTAAPGGCVYRLVVEYAPRPGFAGLFDRLLLKRSVEQAMRRTVRNLERVFQNRRSRVSARHGRKSI